MIKKKKWIPTNLKKGALTDTAKAEDAVTSKGQIAMPWLKKKAKKKGKTSRRAKLALAFKGMGDGKPC